MVIGAISTIDVEVLLTTLPSAKCLHNSGNSQLFWWENSLCLWQFSIAMSVIDMGVYMYIYIYIHIFIYSINPWVLAIQRGLHFLSGWISSDNVGLATTYGMSGRWQALRRFLRLEKPLGSLMWLFREVRWVALWVAQWLASLRPTTLQKFFDLGPDIQIYHIHIHLHV